MIYPRMNLLLLESLILTAELFAQANTVWAALFLVIQQGLVALSTFFIIKIGESIGVGSNVLLYLCLFAATLVLVYLPGIYYLIFTEKVKYEAFRRYSGLIIEANKGIISHYADPNYRKDKEPWLTNESYLVIQEAVEVFSDIVSVGLNILFNMLVMSLLIDKALFVAYGLSLVILFFVQKFSQSILGKLANKYQTERKKMQHTLLRGWDNIFLGNTPNLKIWLNKFNTCWRDTQSSAVKNQAISNSVSSLAMVLALIPIMISIGLFFVTNINNQVLITAMVVTFPRQLQIIQNMFAIFSGFVHWIGVKAKLDGIGSGLASNKSEIADRINWGNIYIYDKGGNAIRANSCVDLIRIIETNKHNRISIYGNNGSGKSSILHKVEESLGNKAYYLPPTNSLEFAIDQDRALSTGQKQSTIIREISKMPDIEYFLLDEWDANLDQENFKKLNSLIEQLTEARAVIEVLHKSTI